MLLKQEKSWLENKGPCSRRVSTNPTTIFWLDCSMQRALYPFEVCGSRNRMIRYAKLYISTTMTPWLRGAFGFIIEHTRTASVLKREQFVPDGTRPEEAELVRQATLKPNAEPLSCNGTERHQHSGRHENQNIRLTRLSGTTLSLDIRLLSS